MPEVESEHAGAAGRPVLYSFRRCPYAIRARLGLASAGVRCELREVFLRDKPAEFLAASPTATVPALVTGRRVIDESLDIMLWALGRNDPESWLDMPAEGHALISECDGPFKDALDRYKYDTRYPEADREEERAKASDFVHALEVRMTGREWLFGAAPRLADMAILPFVRQFAHVDREWFAARPWPGVIDWLERFKASRRFVSVMHKYPKWQAGDPVTLFPGQP